jgi:alpha-D-ribose 1-methylphosphonate 5-triphosphate synthase subunit PhnG
MPPQNKYGVHNRLALLENAVTELKREKAILHTHLSGKLETLVNDAKNVIQDSIRVPQDGKDGIDGRAGATGPAGPRGDVLVIGESELADTVRKLRIELKEKHAAHIAVLVNSIEHHKQGNNGVHRLFVKLLESIKNDIGRLR